MNGYDDDLAKMSRSELQRELRRLRDGVRSHRDQRGDDRCWLDDEKLYASLPEGLSAKTTLDPELMIQNCRRFIATRVHPNDRFAWGDTPGGSLLPALEQVERELPTLLLVDDDWNSLFVDDEFPHVERVWMPYGEGRIFLHRIHPCEEGQALYHPHPWPSAVRVLYGWYETAYGHGPGPEPPPMGWAKVVGAGDRYEMVNPEAWHYVRPLGGPAVTLMVAGKPWSKPPHRKGRNLRPLSDSAKQEMIEIFRRLFPRK